jgi:predicted RNA binding protein YcfA (HicA-like mRNA interferase family)
MRLPRQLSGQDLVKALARLGYEQTRQTGSHIRVTTQFRGEHHVTVPDRRTLPLGTLKSIVRDVARHFERSSDDVVSTLFE